MTIYCPHADWLVEAGKLAPYGGPGEYVMCIPDANAKGLTVDAANAAIEAQYGKDTMLRAHRHGSAFMVRQERNRWWK